MKFKANPAPTEGAWTIGKTEVAIDSEKDGFKSSGFQVGVCFFSLNNIQNI